MLRAALHSPGCAGSLSGSASQHLRNCGNAWFAALPVRRCWPVCGAPWPPTLAGARQPAPAPAQVRMIAAARVSTWQDAKHEADLYGEEAGPGAPSEGPARKGAPPRCRPYAAASDHGDAE